MAVKPTTTNGEKAAELLGLKVSDLAGALRSSARLQYRAEANRIAGRGIRPDHRLANRLLAAAEACDLSDR